MQIDCYKVSAVVLAQGHNPTILHPSFLQNEGIVPPEWEPSKPPVCTPPFAAVSFTSGFSFVVEQERLVVSFSGEKAELRILDVAEMAMKYTAKLPHVSYTAVGINFDTFYPMNDPAGWILQRFIRQGPWNSEELPLAAAKQGLTYNFPDCQLNISIEAGSRSDKNQNSQSGVVLHANYHSQCSGEYPLYSVRSLLQEAKQRKEHFMHITGLLLGES